MKTALEYVRELPIHYVKDEEGKPITFVNVYLPDVNANAGEFLRLLDKLLADRQSAIDAAVKAEREAIAAMIETEVFERQMKDGTQCIHGKYRWHVCFMCIAAAIRARGTEGK